MRLTLCRLARKLLNMNVKTVIVAGATSLAVGAAVKAATGSTPSLARWIAGVLVTGERVASNGRRDAERLLAETVEDVQDMLAEARAARNSNS